MWARGLSLASFPAFTPPNSRGALAETTAVTHTLWKSIPGVWVTHPNLPGPQPRAPLGAERPSRTRASEREPHSRIQPGCHRVERGSGHSGEGRRGAGEAWQGPRRQVMERRLPKGGELTAGKPHGS